MSTQETNGQQEKTIRSEAAESKLPEWLKPELFENILKETLIGYKEIKNFKAQSALPPGENYGTTILRIEIEAEVEDGDSKLLSFMLKLEIGTEMYKDMMQKHNVFDVERGMYLEIVPEMEQMYRDVGLDIKFSPKCFKLPIVKNHVLLEDLRPRGFKNVKRQECLDMEHTKCVLKKLAQWHAASAVRVANKGIYADMYLHGFMREENRAIVKQMHDSVGKTLLKCLRNLKGNESYIDCLEPLVEKTADMIYESFKMDPNEFNVLNHGDFWSNNIMFQYDDFGKIKETYFVDYQIPKYGTPAQDLIYFLLSSTKLEIKLKQFENFIKYYHDELVEHLKLLQYSKKLPTLKEIHIALYKYGFFGYTTVTGVLAAVLVEPTENATFDNFLSDSSDGMDFKINLFSNDRYRKHAEIIFPWLLNRGALEC